MDAGGREQGPPRVARSALPLRALLHEHHVGLFADRPRLRCFTSVRYALPVRPSLRPRSAMLRSMLTRGFCLVFVLATGAAAACSSSSPAPTAPAATPADSTPDAATGREVQISGSVSRIGGSCPAVRFILGRVTVQTDRATTFVGGGCASLATGVSAVVRGSRQSDGSLAASAVTTRGAPTR